MKRIVNLVAAIVLVVMAISFSDRVKADFSFPADDGVHPPVECMRFLYKNPDIPADQWQWTPWECDFVKPDRSIYNAMSQAPNGYTQYGGDKYYDVPTYPWVSDEEFTYWSFTGTYVEPQEVPKQIHELLGNGTEKFPNGTTLNGFQFWFIEGNYLVVREAIIIDGKMSSKGRAWFILNGNSVNESCGKSYWWDGANIVYDENSGICKN